MALRVMEQAIPGLRVIVPEVFRDRRGLFLETFRTDRYPALGIAEAFRQDNCSHSVRGVLRGLHYQAQHPQAKLVTVVQGEIFDVAVDIRRGSPTFGRWAAVTLSGENRHQFFLPAGFAHGFCVLSETADVWYKCSEVYDPADDRGILWSDPGLGIRWPLADPVVSERDARHPRLAEVEAAALPVYGAGPSR